MLYLNNLNGEELTGEKLAEREMWVYAFLMKNRTALEKDYLGEASALLLKKKNIMTCQGVLDSLVEISKKSAEEIISGGRGVVYHDDLISIRQVYCYLCVKYLRNHNTLTTIGDVIKKSYGTVIHSCRVVENILELNHSDKKSLFIKYLVKSWESL